MTDMAAYDAELIELGFEFEDDPPEGEEEPVVEVTFLGDATDTQE